MRWLHTPCRWDGGAAQAFGDGRAPGRGKPLPAPPPSAAAGTFGFICARSPCSYHLFLHCVTRCAPHSTLLLAQTALLCVLPTNHYTPATTHLRAKCNAAQKGSSALPASFHARLPVRRARGATPRRQVTKRRSPQRHHLHSHTSRTTISRLMCLRHCWQHRTFCLSATTARGCSTSP